MAVVQLVGPTAIPRQLSRSLDRAGHRIHACLYLDAFTTQEGEADTDIGCVLVDIDVPENLKALPGFLAHAAIRGFAVVVLATQPEPADIIAAMKIGVSDFLIKPVPEPVLREAIEAAITQGRGQRNRAARMAFLKVRYESLTYPEKLVARLVNEGHRNRAIAESLNVAERTVKGYRKLAFKKLAVDSVAELVHAIALLDSDVLDGASYRATGTVQGSDKSGSGEVGVQRAPKHAG
ncbi:response regulator transcription factor [Variovorax sp. GT1P44]|uniref:response regulator transcription factor n=1 Tax=Variovorax sp. GT1P44 TaxID=3443742 RepID=UPI003F4702F0